MKTVKMILGIVLWLLCAPVLLIVMGAIGLVGAPFGLLRPATMKQRGAHGPVQRDWSWQRDVAGNGI